MPRCGARATSIFCKTSARPTAPTTTASRLERTVALTHGGRIQIGETEIVFKDKATERALPETTIEDDAPLPEATIAFDSAQHTTSGLLEAIEGARTQTSGRFDVATVIPHRTGSTAAASVTAGDHGDLLALISKVGVTLLASATLDETLGQVARLVFEAVPAERCLIMLREAGEGGELKIRAAEMRDRRPEVGEVRVSRTIIEEVVNQGRSVLTSDAQHDPRFRSSTVTFQGIRSVLAVPLGVGDRIFGMIYADSPLADLTLLRRPPQGADDARLGRRHPRRERAAHRRAPRTARASSASCNWRARFSSASSRPRRPRCRATSYRASASPPTRSAATTTTSSSAPTAASSSRSATSRGRGRARRS